MVQNNLLLTAANGNVLWTAFQIDDVAPTVNLSIVGVGDTNQSVVLDVQASDIGSGVALTSIYEVTG